MMPDKERVQQQTAQEEKPAKEKTPKKPGKQQKNCNRTKVAN